MSDSDAWGASLDPLDDGPVPALSPDEARAVDALRDRLADEALWTEPAPDLRAALLARAAAEAQDRPPAAPVVPPAVAAVVPPVVPPVMPDPRGVPGTDDGAGPRRSRTEGPAAVTPLRSRRRTVRWLAAAAAVAAIGVGAVTVWPRPAEESFLASGTTLAPKASAVVRLEEKSAGLAIQLEITGLAPAPPGAYYAAWLRGPSGVVPVGTFHWHKGGIPIDLWSGVLTDGYPELFVTLQREGEPAAPSDRVVLVGRVR